MTNQPKPRGCGRKKRRRKMATLARPQDSAVPDLSDANENAHHSGNLNLIQFKVTSSPRVFLVAIVEDVLLNVFDLLDENDLIRCEDVCLRWRQIIRTRNIWPRLFRRTVFHRNINSITLSFIVLL